MIDADETGRYKKRTSSNVSKLRINQNTNISMQLYLYR